MISSTIILTNLSNNVSYSLWDQIFVDFGWANVPLPVFASDHDGVFRLKLGVSAVDPECYLKPGLHVH